MQNKPYTLETMQDGQSANDAAFSCGTLDLRLADCMELMADYPDGHFDLAIVDPPYGLGETAKRSKQRVPKTQSKKWKNRRAPEYGGSETWDDNPPPPEYFLELKRVSRNQIIWGANHFGMMPPSSGWIVWHKKRHDEKNDFSDAELAWSSMQKGCRLFHMPWIGFGAVNAGENRIHPTQKPVALYRWLLANYAKPGMKVLDTHLGSGSIAIAAHYAGMHLTACEIEPDYFYAAKARIERETAQTAFL
jgi:site-specific DNA-methyltransferase (adenine-specific)